MHTLEVYDSKDFCFFFRLFIFHSLSQSTAPAIKLAAAFWKKSAKDALALAEGSSTVVACDDLLRHSQGLSRCPSFGRLPLSMGNTLLFELLWM
jgi:hypothetical protein